MSGPRFAIVGAGATGAFLGARLARAGEDVTLIARGPHLAAMRDRGVRVIGDEGEFTAHPIATDDWEAIRAADVVIVTLKAHSLPGIAPRLAGVLGPDAAVVTAQNGIPWWYFDRYDGPLAGTRLETVDPGGVIAAHIAPRRVIGCIVWPATQIVEPGVIEHIEGNRFTIGEPDGERSARCQAIASALIKGGLKCPVSRNIRQDIWLKLLGNVAFNPLSALTRATLATIAGQPETRRVARAIMEEADAVARALDVRLSIGVDQRLAGAEKVGEHKTSMLQDIETGRPIEIEALAGAVVELGDLLDIPLPHLRTVYACTKLLDATLRGAAASPTPATEGAPESRQSAPR